MAGTSYIGGLGGHDRPNQVVKGGKGPSLELWPTEQSLEEFEGCFVGTLSKPWDYETSTQFDYGRNDGY